jgi:hypothetical protein
MYRRYDSLYSLIFAEFADFWCVEDMIRRTRWFSLNSLVSPKFSLFAVFKFVDVISWAEFIFEFAFSKTDDELNISLLY